MALRKKVVCWSIGLLVLWSVGLVSPDAFDELPPGCARLEGASDGRTPTFQNKDTPPLFSVATLPIGGAAA